MAMPSGPQIAVLVAARKNSKFLSKFLFGLLKNTDHPSNLEVLVMLNKHDTWNDDLAEHFSNVTRGTYSLYPRFRFFREDRRLGRAGLHLFFNDLYKHSTAPWVIYFCEDHYISMPGWDSYVLGLILNRNLSPTQPWCLVPKFDNAGAMNHILSRGYCEALGDKVGGHGWIDSYINAINARIPAERILRYDDEMFHDFTHDKPGPFEEGGTTAPVPAGAMRKEPPFESPEYWRRVEKDAKRLNVALERLAG